jgi:hypothetical protein
MRKSLWQENMELVSKYVLVSSLMLLVSCAACSFLFLTLNINDEIELLPQTI